MKCVLELKLWTMTESQNRIWYVHFGNKRYIYFCFHGLLTAYFHKNEMAEWTCFLVIRRQSLQGNTCTILIVERLDRGDVGQWQGKCCPLEGSKDAKLVAWTLEKVVRSWETVHKSNQEKATQNGRSMIELLPVAPVLQLFHSCLIFCQVIVTNCYHCHLRPFL